RNLIRVCVAANNSIEPLTASASLGSRTPMLEQQPQTDRRRQRADDECQWHKPRNPFGQWRLHKLKQGACRPKAARREDEADSTHDDEKCRERIGSRREGRENRGSRGGKEPEALPS